MKNTIGIFTSVFIVCLFITMAYAGEQSKSGEDLFKQHCALCHPDGGNVINPEKTLHKEALESNNIKTPSDIIETMRNPGPGMKKFDEETIPDKDAKEIAEYILEMFK